MCYPDKDNPASTQGTSTRSTDLKYVIPDQNNGNKHVHIGSQRPQADGSSPTPASGLSQGAAQSCCPSWVLTCALSFVAALTMASLSNIGMTSKWVPSDVTSFSSRRWCFATMLRGVILCNIFPFGSTFLCPGRNRNPCRQLLSEYNSKIVNTGNALRLDNLMTGSCEK